MYSRSSLSPLERHLSPLDEYLSDVMISEISINKPGLVFLEKNGLISSHHNSALTFEYLTDLSIFLGNYNKKPINSDCPHFSGVMPGGHRIQIVIPPVTESGVIAMSIRKQICANFGLNELHNKGMFDKINPGHCSIETLHKAVVEKRNILISGGTGTGKTTFMNALIREIPTDERLVVIEDTREISTSHSNQVFLTASTEKDRNHGMLKNLESALRLRPDRILVGEVRGAEAAMLLEAIATGHDGAICTLHAPTPQLALTRLAIMAERGGMRHQTRAELVEYIYTIIDIVIQLKRTTTGQRYVSDIFTCKE